MIAELVADIWLITTIAETTGEKPEERYRGWGVTDVIDIIGIIKDTHSSDLLKT